MAKAIVRLKDIAGRTGYSTNTVSLALRDSPRIPEPTRELIHRAARDLNYLPNQIAKSLVSRETKTIGLVLTDLSNPALTHTAQTIELALSDLGYGTLFATSNNTLADEIRAIEMFRARQVDGMLIYPTSHRQLDHIRSLRQSNYPIVLLVGDPDAGIDAVCMDEQRGAYKATTHLIEQGHRRIGLIDGARAYGNREKHDGFCQALADAGISLDESLAVMSPGRSVARGYEAAETMLSRPERPTALLASNDSLAIGALHWCLKHGLGVPDDLAIIGFDNIEFAAHASTPISSVDYPAGLLSRGAIDRLMLLIAASGPLPEAQVSMIDPDLVLRESTLGRARP